MCEDLFKIVKTGDNNSFIDIYGDNARNIYEALNKL